jgi:hypothetical protein
VVSAIRTEYSAEKIAIERKRAAEKASRGAKSSKKSRSEASQQASETASRPVENYKDLLNEETSEHYKEQRKLNEDWNNMKTKLIFRQGQCSRPS